MNYINDLQSLSKAGVVKFEITADDLLKLVKHVARETADLVIEGFKKQQSPELITRKEARELLNVKTDVTMIKWEEKGYLMPSRIGSRIFYRKDEVFSAVEKFTRNDLC